MSKSNVDQQGTKENPRAPLRHLRAVGRLEWFLFARTKARADSCVIVAARYLPSHSGDVINKAALYPALGEVVRNNVALASRIAPASDRRGPPEWVRLPSLDLDRVVEFINDDFSDLESIFESQFRRGFDADTDLPLWRLAVLRDGTLLFAFDHALCDGLGGLAFHRILLAALQENRTSPTSVQFAENQNLPPALEDATHVSIPWRTVVRETLKLFNPLAWRRHLTTWAGNRIPASFELDTRVHVLTYCPAEAQRLTSLAHAHKATLTATLHTLALLALSRLLDKHAHGKFKATTTYVPLSLHRATGASANDFCNHYSYLFSEHKLFSGPVLHFGEDEGDGPESFPWADAAQFTQKMREAAPHAASAMGLLKLVGSPGRRGGFVRRPLGHRRVIGIELSNLGSFSLGLGEEEEEEELEGRHAVEVVPTPAVAVAETVKSQDADRAVGDASAPAARGAETKENASPTAVPVERTDTSQTGDGDERFATPPDSMPESPISAAAPVAQIDTEGKGKGKGRARETIDDVPLLPLAGDKEMSASPHGSDLAQDAPTTSGGPLTEGEHDALNIPAPESEDKATSSEPAANVGMSISSPESARNVDDHEDGEPTLSEDAHWHNHGTMPAKEAQAVAPIRAPAPDKDSPDSAPHTADVQTEAAPPPARGRTISEAASNNNTASPRTRDRLPSPCAKPELELVSPHCCRRAPTGRADPPHAETPHPTPAAHANQVAVRDPAPTGNARKPVVANSPPPDNDAARGTGQARRVGNRIPTQAQEPPRRSGQPEPHQGSAQPLWALREVLYAQADGTLGAALKVCVAGTPAGGLGVAISWGASAVDEEFGKAFVVGFADGVRELTLDVDIGIGGEPGDGEGR
ncbi:hypothetical protein V8D89_012921 [Ganoderma adspersum]